MSEALTADDVLNMRRKILDIAGDEENLKLIMNAVFCPECGKPFTPKRKDQVWCSKQCGNRYRVRKHRAKID